MREGDHLWLENYRSSLLNYQIGIRRIVRKAQTCKRSGIIQRYPLASESEKFFVSTRWEFDSVYSSRWIMIINSIGWPTENDRTPQTAYVSLPNFNKILISASQSGQKWLTMDLWVRSLRVSCGWWFRHF